MKANKRLASVFLLVAFLASMGSRSLWAAPSMETLRACPLFPDYPYRSINDHFNELMGMISPEVINKLKQTDVRCAELFEKLKTTGDQYNLVSTKSTKDKNGNEDPNAWMSRQNAQMDLTEAMYSTVSSDCQKYLKDPKPLLTTSYFLMTTGANLVGSDKVGQSAVTLAGLGLIGTTLLKLFHHHSPTVFEKLADDNKTMDNFIARLCLLYRYQYEFDNAYPASGDSISQKEREIEETRAKIEEIDQKLRSTSCPAEPPAPVAQPNLKTQIQSIMASLGANQIPVKSCQLLRSELDPSKDRFKSVEKLNASLCSNVISESCAITAKDPSVSLDQSDFCRNWCKIKRDFLSADFDCIDEGDKRGAMLDRMDSVLRYVMSSNIKLDEVVPPVPAGNAAVLQQIADYKKLQKQKAELEASLKAAMAAVDVSKSTKVSASFWVPLIDQKLNAIGDQILNRDFNSYVQGIYKNTQKYVSKDLRNQLKDASKAFRKGPADTESQQRGCQVIRQVERKLADIRQQYSQVSTFCEYLGDPPKVPFKNKSLSFTDISPNLKVICDHHQENLDRTMKERSREINELKLLGDVNKCSVTATAGAAAAAVAAP